MHKTISTQLTGNVQSLNGGGIQGSQSLHQSKMTINFSLATQRNSNKSILGFSQKFIEAKNQDTCTKTVTVSLNGFY